MNKIIRLTESDLHNIVKESVYRILQEYGLGGATSCAGVYDTPSSTGTYEGGKAQSKEVTDYPLGGVIRKGHNLGNPTKKKEKGIDMTPATDRSGGKNHSIAINYVGESAIHEAVEEGIGNWLKGAALGGMMALSPMQGNAQTQDYNSNRQDRNSVEALTKQYNKAYSIKELVQMFPQAYVDRNANPKVWIENARQGKYSPTVKDNGDGRYRTMMVAYIAAKNGQNPWDALVKRYCPNQIGKTYKIGDF